MEKMLANFLKAMGLDADLIQEKMQQFFSVVDDFNNRLARVEQRQMRVETMLLRLCQKSKIDLSEIYEPIDDETPSIERNDHGNQQENTAPGA